MKQSTTKEKLNLIKKVVLSTPDKCWDMKVWREDTECGFVGCAIGNSIERYPDLGLKLVLATEVWGIYSPDYYVVHHEKSASIDTHAVSAWLGWGEEVKDSLSLTAILFNSVYYQSENLSEDPNKFYVETYLLTEEGDTSLFQDLPTQVNVAKRLQLAIDKYC